LRPAFVAYFAGDRNALASVAWEGAGTAFQRQVWAALCLIPAGETWSYARLAEHIGRPTAVRAVGLANGSNPVALVVPCHRVIGSNGSLTGYGGGLHRKRWLLRHEGAPFREVAA
jgi:methylated-DNA-[protein]-cysteine S-methyltransferase